MELNFTSFITKSSSIGIKYSNTISGANGKVTAVINNEKKKRYQGSLKEKYWIGIHNWKRIDLPMVLVERSAK